jgi:hypothetical protein
MKYVAIVSLGIAFFAIFIMSLANTWPNPSEAAHFSPSDWMNPDGGRGFISPAANSLQQENGHAWTNPDGAHGVAGIAFGRARASIYSWVNPDGHQGMYDKGPIGKPIQNTTVMTISR